MYTYKSVYFSASMCWCACVYTEIMHLVYIQVAVGIARVSDSGIANRRVCFWLCVFLWKKPVFSQQSFDVCGIEIISELIGHTHQIPHQVTAAVQQQRRQSWTAKKSAGANRRALDPTELHLQVVEKNREVRNHNLIQTKITYPKKCICFKLTQAIQDVDEFLHGNRFGEM